jgi:hypothetical protein
MEEKLKLSHLFNGFLAYCLIEKNDGIFVDFWEKWETENQNLHNAENEMQTAIMLACWKISTYYWWTS